jgi:hypothetical protein
MNVESRKNFIHQLFCRSIDVMKNDNWEWPEHWDTQYKLRFLNESLNYATDNEFWEQAAIIRDVKNEIVQETPGSVSGDSEG